MQPVVIMFLIGSILAMVAIVTYLIVEKKKTAAATKVATSSASSRAATTTPATSSASSTAPATSSASSTAPATSPATSLVTLFESGCSFPNWNNTGEKLVDQNLINAITPFLFSLTVGPFAKPGENLKVGDSTFVLDGNLLLDEANYTKVRAALKQAIDGRDDVIVLITHARSKTDSSDHSVSFSFAPSSSIDLSKPASLIPRDMLDTYTVKVLVVALRSSQPTIIRPNCMQHDDVFSSTLPASSGLASSGLASSGLASSGFGSSQVT